jgi:putative MATE family efflux protein
MSPYKYRYFRRIFNKNIIYDIREALYGEEQDYTAISLKRAIFLLSIPMVLEMIMESVFAIVDILFVSRLGADAIATVGFTESMITIVYALAFGLSMATTAMVSRRIGEKKKKAANDVAFQAIITGFLISLLIAIPASLNADGLLRLMGAEENIIRDYSIYTVIAFASNGIIMLLFIINAIFRSSGDAATSMKVLWIANGLNLILDPLLIFGIGPFPELGIKGAAIATAIGRGVGVVIQFYILFRGNRIIKLGVENFKIRLNVILNLLKVSGGGIIQNIIATSSWIGLVRIVGEFGSEAVAGYTIAIRIIIFALLPSWGISNASATLVGQNLGAKRPDRAEQSVWATGKINMILLSTIGLVFILIPNFFLSFFSEDELVIKAGAVGLRIISFGFIAYGLGMVLIQSFNGAGDTYTPTLMNFICFWLIELPVAYFLAIVMGLEEKGVFYSIIIAESILTILAFILFKRGKWKLKEV